MDRLSPIYVLGHFFFAFFAFFDYDVALDVAVVVVFVVVALAPLVAGAAADASVVFGFFALGVRFFGFFINPSMYAN